MVVYVLIKNASRFKYIDRVKEYGMCVCDDNKCLCIIPEYMYNEIVEDKEASKYIKKIEEYNSLLKAVDIMYDKIVEVS